MDRFKAICAIAFVFTLILAGANAAKSDAIFSNAPIAFIDDGKIYELDENKLVIKSLGEPIEQETVIAKENLQFVFVDKENIYAGNKGKIFIWVKDALDLVKEIVFPQNNLEYAFADPFFLHGVDSEGKAYSWTKSSFKNQEWAEPQPLTAITSSSSDLGTQSISESASNPLSVQITYPDGGEYLHGKALVRFDWKSGIKQNKLLANIYTKSAYWSSYLCTLAKDVNLLDQNICIDSDNNQATANQCAYQTDLKNCHLPTITYSPTYLEDQVKFFVAIASPSCSAQDYSNDFLKIYNTVPIIEIIKPPENENMSCGTYTYKFTVEDLEGDPFDFAKLILNPQQTWKTECQQQLGNMDVNQYCNFDGNTAHKFTCQIPLNLPELYKPGESCCYSPDAGCSDSNFSVKIWIDDAYYGQDYGVYTPYVYFPPYCQPSVAPVAPNYLMPESGTFNQQVYIYTGGSYSMDYQFCADTLNSEWWMIAPPCWFYEIEATINGSNWIPLTYQFDWIGFGEIYLIKDILDYFAPAPAETYQIDLRSKTCVGNPEAPPEWPEERFESCSNYYNPPGTITLTSGPSCEDGTKNGDETDIDCGGGCPACQNEKGCLLNEDCESEYCNSSNVCSDFIPIIEEILQDPVYPTYNENVSINATISGNVQNIQINYSIDGIQQQPIQMQQVSGNYQATIPKQPIGKKVGYKIGVNNGETESEEKEYYSVEKNIKIVIILAKYFDTIGIPKFEILPDHINEVKEYYLGSLASMRAVRLIFDVEDNKGNWYTLPHNYAYYSDGVWPDNIIGSILDGYSSGLLNDLVSVSDEDIDFSKYDAFIAIENEGGMRKLAAVNFFQQPMTQEGKKPAAYLSKFSDTVIWSHEIGHILGLPDLYAEPPTPLFTIGGEIGPWGLMGRAKENSPISSWSRAYLGWLKPQIVSVYPNNPVDLTLIPLTEKKWGDRIYQVQGIGDSFIVEARKEEDSPGGFEGVPLYKLKMPIISGKLSWIEFIPSQNTNSNDIPTLGNTSKVYEDAWNLIKFNYIENYESGEYRPIVKVERMNLSNMTGISIASNLASLLGGEAVNACGDPLEDAPDLGLHAYTVDGNHVGINYETNEFENQISGAIASGDLLFGREWIFVPEGIEVEFKVNSNDVNKFLEQYPEFQEQLFSIDYNMQIVEYDENATVALDDNNNFVRINSIEHEPVQGTIGPGEERTLFATAIAANSLKLEAAASLEAAKENGKKIGKEIDKIVKHIQNSLEDKLWIDTSHLNPKHGEKVFHEEYKAVKRMQKEIKKKEIAAELKEVFKGAINNLVKADETLAKVAIEDAKLTPVQNPKNQKKVDQKIKSAEKELAKAYEELEKGKQDNAIKTFEKAWKHSQQAIEYAVKD